MGKSAGSGSGSAPSRPKGTVFGVNGVSKTGSTARDAAIGFTAGEGTGKAGANFEALSGATREQRDKAVAAAQAAQAAGTSPQRAAAEAIGAPIPINPVARAIGLDSPYARPITAADEALFDDFIANQTNKAFRAGEVAGIGRQPLREISPSTPGMTGPGSFMSGAQEISGMNRIRRFPRPNITAPPSQPDELTTEAFSSSPLASLLGDIQRTPAVDVSGVTNMALARGISNPVYEAELNRRALAGDQEAKTLFDNALVKGYTQPSDLGVADRISSPVPLPPVRPTDSRISAEEVLGVPLPPVRPTGISALAPAQVGPPAAQMQTIGPATQAVQGEYYGEDLQQPDIFGTPGGQFTELYGFPDATAQGEFLTQAMRGPNVISQLMNFSLLNRGIEALTGTSPSESNMEAGRQNMRNLFDLGGAFNPETGRVEAALPSGQLQMNQFGNVTYSGMPDPNYSGPFANLVNPPEQERGGMQPIVEPMMEEEVVNPCPPGYALVDGVCQPLAGTAQPAAATPAVVPSSFQPVYQPFQPQPLNPFVLSPTGAALGRSV